MAYNKARIISEFLGIIEQNGGKVNIEDFKVKMQVMFGLTEKIEESEDYEDAEADKYLKKVFDSEEE